MRYGGVDSASVDRQFEAAIAGLPERENKF